MEISAPQKRVYFLANDLKLTVDAINYLIKREMSVMLFPSIGDLLVAIKSEKPDCVVLSVELIEDTIKIPLAIESQYNLPVIGLAELDNIFSTTKLNAVRSQYKIRPPVTGAASYRVIQKALADRK